MDIKKKTYFVDIDGTIFVYRKFETYKKFFQYPYIFYKYLY